MFVPLRNNITFACLVLAVSGVLEAHVSSLSSSKPSASTAAGPDCYIPVNGFVI